MTHRRLEVFAVDALEPNQVAVRPEVAREMGLMEGEAVYVCAFHDPGARLSVPGWRAAEAREVGPDGCLVAPELLRRVEALAPDRLVVLRCGKVPRPSFHRLSWTHREAAREPRPEDLIILLDVSLSMAGAPLRHARHALSAFVDQKRRQGLADRLGLVTFGGEGPGGVRVVCPPQADDGRHQGFVDGVRSVRVDGFTPMAEALARALELVTALGEEKGRRRRVILVSDGHPCPGGADEVLAVVEDLAAAGVHVATVGVGEGFDRSLLAQVAARTEAPFVEARSIRRLPRLLEALAQP